MIVHTKTNHKLANLQGEISSAINYADFQVSTPWILGGLGKQPVTYPPCAALTSAVAAGRIDRTRGRSRRGKLVIFTGLLERMYTAKELLLKLHRIDLAPY